MPSHTNSLHAIIQTPAVKPCSSIATSMIAFGDTIVPRGLCTETLMPVSGPKISRVEPKKRDGNDQFQIIRYV